MIKDYEASEVYFTLLNVGNKDHEVVVKSADVFDKYVKDVDGRGWTKPVSKKVFYEIVRIFGVDIKKIGGVYKMIIPSGVLPENREHFAIGYKHCVTGKKEYYYKNKPDDDRLMHLLSYIKHLREYFPKNFINETKELKLYRDKMIDELLDRNDIPEPMGLTNENFERFEDRDIPTIIRSSGSEDPIPEDYIYRADRYGRAELGEV